MDTLVHDPYREALHAAFGPRLAEALAERDATTWPRFERGQLTEDEFWAAHAAWSPDLAAFERARREGTRWIAGMRELVGALRAAGHRIVVASNYPSWIDDLEQRLLAGLVDDVVASCRIGVRKPEPAFYDRLATAAGAPPQRTLFVDDREANVAAARQAGMHGLRFESAQALRRDLAELGIVLG